MLDIVQYLPGKRKQSSSGWISFNGPCCVHNGESADRRQRGGLLRAVPRAGVIIASIAISQPALS
jgi:hypothetical protein